jgi:hypothetical protein
MVGIPLMIFIVLFFLYKSNTFAPLYSAFPANLVIALAVIIILAGISAFLYYFKKLPAARNGVNLREKLTVYYRICFVQFTILSIVSVTDLGLYLISGHKLFAGVYILLLIMLALNNPSYYNVVGNLKLLKDEREIMKNNLKIA